ncbi:DUF6900 domain-containing protein [Burkholderia sp. HI2500]|uniref:DUF6900 domain-containing protein n=1 Tax=Burkholderia sp. HI2500 TaxID=2015358 RepID=UPI000B7AB9FC|nr:hypothetical protein [Burkholderia sp. HI2500]OXJ06650.1 hypothetical protein CFB45_37530 [Burkholderia sp. HI2500]
MTHAEFEALLEAIAREHLFISTLEERKSDRLDFHSVAVWTVRAALAAAYEAGRKIGRKPRG